MTLETSLLLVVGLVVVGMLFRDLWPRLIHQKDAKPCAVCGAESTHPIPRAVRPVWGNRIAIHMGRVYGTPNERHIVFPRWGKPRLCEDHGIAVFRELESFHANQHARELQATAELAKEAAWYESEGVIVAVQTARLGGKVV